jgi:hypothetical protein
MIVIPRPEQDTCGTEIGDKGLRQIKPRPSKLHNLTLALALWPRRAPPLLQIKPQSCQPVRFQVLLGTHSSQAAD